MVNLKLYIYPQYFSENVPKISQKDNERTNRTFESRLLI